MSQSTMNTTVPAWSSSKEHGRDSPLCLSPSEPQRGRKRVRSHLPVMRPLHHEPSCESTLRGRRRNRSNSPVGPVSRNTSVAARDRRQSPLKQRHVSIIQQHNTRRSQCPSRSRSANAPPGSTGAQRRRQRTRSRSRVHRLEGMFSTLEMNSPLQFEVLINELSLESVTAESGQPED
ncbi:hypothetical protein PpBr36_01788 [Pyricularia pennisetigena]|uniref:hypothetical protein n=1 Tax=Pyricularia pennisetigena TaxID=1578925 RepID=UPI0011514E43|nr:hypothetical protein PpBr36_01788 [Pyricularia pennisetigena]TLS27758.1 hypothetical protein PpBr36_01788 [Pyricularia pennisetigena]